MEVNSALVNNCDGGFAVALEDELAAGRDAHFAEVQGRAAFAQPISRVSLAFGGRGLYFISEFCSDVNNIRSFQQLNGLVRFKLKELSFRINTAVAEGVVQSSFNQPRVRDGASEFNSERDRHTCRVELIS